MKETLRGGVSRVVVGTGLSAAWRRSFKKRGTVILMGHRVAEDDDGYFQGLRPEWFEAQIAYLARHYEIVSLETLVACLEENRDPPANSVALTFDDGFRDNYTEALPILKRHGAPATVFVVSGCVTGGELPWSQRLGYLFQHTSVGRVRHASLGNDEADLATERLRRACYLRAKAIVRGLSREPREAVLSELSKLLQVEAPRDRMLTWEQAREMQAAGMTFGAHTYSHSLLALMPSAEAQEEMERSARDLREQLGVSRPTFAFPGGSSDDRLVAMAREQGFRSLFRSRAEVRLNRPGTATPFSLSRVGMPNAPADVLEAELDGPFHAVRSALRGLRPDSDT